MGFLPLCPAEIPTLSATYLQELWAMRILFWLTLALICMGVTFVTGVWWGYENHPESKVVEKPTPIGDFREVEVTMETSMGNTFRWVCDLHLVPLVGGTTANCDYQDGRTRVTP